MSGFKSFWYTIQCIIFVKSAYGCGCYTVISSKHTLLLLCDSCDCDWGWRFLHWINEHYRYFVVVAIIQYILLLLTLQPAVGFGLSNNTSPFSPICHQLSPSSHSQHLKISFYFFSPSFPGSSSSSRLFKFLSEDLFGHPILLHSLQVTQPTYPLPLYPFYCFFSFTQLF